MIEKAWISIFVCLIAVWLTLVLVRRTRWSLGLPLAYVMNLLLIHIPGAYAYAVSNGTYAGVLVGGDYPAEGIALAAVGSVCFVVGLFFVRSGLPLRRTSEPLLPFHVERKFLIFCLAGGWLFAFGLTPLRGIPTIGAVINFGGAVWILAVMMGLARAWTEGKSKNGILWLAAALVYPLWMLLFGGFLSYGSTVIIIIGSFFIVRTRSISKSILMIMVLGYVGISVFVNYFNSRDELRSVLWSGAGTQQRIYAVLDAFSGFTFFSADNPDHLDALAQRLNQNEFVGLAADRLQHGDVEYLAGRSFLEGIIAPIPRLLWPSKPVHGGSPAVISDMTGLVLNDNTSWGVGNVMEFYINFGMWSLVPAFIVLGILIGWLDIRAVLCLERSEPGRALLFFLPGVALIQPNGSLVEMVGGVFAALLAAFFWKRTWREYGRFRNKQKPEIKYTNWQGRR